MESYIHKKISIIPTIKTIESRINGNISIIPTIRILRLHEGTVSTQSSLISTEI